MPYPIPVNAICEVTFEGNHNGQYVQSILHYRMVGGPTIADGRAALIALANSLEAPGKMFDAWVNALSQDVVFCLVYLQWITPTRYAYVEYAPIHREGQVAQNSLPQNVAAAITKLGEQAGRHNVGTLHMPGVPTTHVADGEITVVGVGRYEVIRDTLDDIHVLAGGQEMTPIIFNRVAPADSKVIVAGDVQTTSRVSRRRTVGLGI